MLLTPREPQWLQYFKLVFLEIQNVPLRTVFANPVTYNYLTHTVAMALLASTHLILMSRDYSSNYQPLTSIYSLTRANTFSLDHVISRGLFIMEDVVILLIDEE